MGKLKYALSIYGTDSAIYDFAQAQNLSGVFYDFRILINLQAGIRRFIETGSLPLPFFEENLPRLREKVLIGDEIGCGIVPLDPLEREWRDQTGFVYQFLARESEIVDRIWAGLPVRMKGPAI